MYRATLAVPLGPAQLGVGRTRSHGERGVARLRIAETAAGAAAARPAAAGRSGRPRSPRAARAQLTGRAAPGSSVPAEAHIERAAVRRLEGAAARRCPPAPRPRSGSSVRFWPAAKTVSPARASVHSARRPSVVQPSLLVGVRAVHEVGACGTHSNLRRQRESRRMGVASSAWQVVPGRAGDVVPVERAIVHELVLGEGVGQPQRERRRACSPRLKTPPAARSPAPPRRRSGGSAPRCGRWAR